MIRGTTPTLGALCDMDLTNFTNICTVEQEDLQYDITPTVIKTDSGCLIYATLTQEQTLSFKANENYSAQMRSIDSNGFCVANAIFTGYVEDVLKNGVITHEEQTLNVIPNPITPTPSDIIDDPLHPNI